MYSFAILDNGKHVRLESAHEYQARMVRIANFGDDEFTAHVQTYIDTRHRIRCLMNNVHWLMWSAIHGMTHEERALVQRFGGTT